MAKSENKNGDKGNKNDKKDNIKNKNHKKTSDKKKYLFKCLYITLVLFSIYSAIIGYKIYNALNNVPDMPKIKYNSWWGPNETKYNQDTSIRPYRIYFTDSMQSQLTKKFEQHRTRDHVASFEDAHFNYGFNSKELEYVFDFWRFKYNLRERQRYLNKYEHFLTSIDGLDIHFMHVKPKVNRSVKVYPILMLHGWPGSFREFYEVIPHLTEKRSGVDFVFQVIVPSLPGFGFSQAPIRPGLSAYNIAIIMQKLMRRMGFQKYYVQGGDFGHSVASFMATIFPDEVLGYHTNYAVNFNRLGHLVWVLGAVYPRWVVDEEHEGRMYPLREKLATLLEEGGYFHMHMTKPDTLGVSLQDSPLGLAAYILEKFCFGTDSAFKNRTDGGLEERYTMTDLLDNVMIYWITDTITSSMRLYAETLNNIEVESTLWSIPTKVPTWGLKLLNEILFQPDFVLRWKFSNYIGSTVLDEGGHFAALEMPKTLADDVFKAVQEFIKFQEVSKM